MEANRREFNLIHNGKLGDIVQAEVGYTHDQRSLQYNPRRRPDSLTRR